MTEDGRGSPSQNTLKQTTTNISIQTTMTTPAAGPSIFKQTSVQAFVKQTTEKPEKQNWGWNQIYGLCGESEHFFMAILNVIG